MDVYRKNFQPLLPFRESVHSLVDFEIRHTPDGWDFSHGPFPEGPLFPLLGTIDVLLAGPPCQGHSSLNNHTRANDPRNSLYLTAVAAAIAVGARFVVIENVPGVVRDRLGVLDIARALLEKRGYKTDAGVIDGQRIGWVQRRRRHFLVATLGPLRPLKDVLDEFRASPIPAGDFLQQCPTRDDVPLLNTWPEYSEETRKRFKFFEMNPDFYDLPCEHRPECHRNGTTYKAVYGRMRPDQPIPTITTGFLTPGRGRFVHPTELRTLTPSEAAYAQGFPRWFKFGIDPEPTRSELSKWIGDAVPLPLGYVALHAFRDALGGRPR